MDAEKLWEICLRACPILFIGPRLSFFNKLYEVRSPVSVAKLARQEGIYADKARTYLKAMEKIGLVKKHDNRCFVITDKGVACMEELLKHI